MSGDNNDLKRALFAVSDAVLGAAVLLVLGVYGGAWLDKKLNTAPWISVSLAILGGGLGLARMVIKANALDTSSSSVKGNSAKSNKESLEGNNEDKQDDDKKQSEPHS